MIRKYRERNGIIIIENYVDLYLDDDYIAISESD